MGWEEGRFETCPYRGESEGGNVRKMDSRPRLYGGGRFAGKRREGWVPACARTTRGRAARFPGCARNDMWVVGMGSRPRVLEAGSAGEQRIGRDGITVGLGGRAVREPPLRERMLSGTGFTPSPVFTRAGSNLPPSRGKGFAGAERAIFIVMTSGEGGMGPRMREDNEGKGSEIPRLRFASLGMTCGGSGEE